MLHQGFELYLSNPSKRQIRTNLAQKAYRRTVVEMQVKVWSPLAELPGLVCLTVGNLKPPMTPGT